MGPRKSTSEWSGETGYPDVLQKLCQEEDVLIIPQFVTIYTTRQNEHIFGRISKDSRMGSTMAANESKEEDIVICGNVGPPQVGIVYSNPDDRETPVAVICKDIYIEYSFVSAFGKSLKFYPTLSTLKIENCCISKEMTEALAFLLAYEPGRWISDLSLDGNEGVSHMFPLFVKLPTGIRYLSLQRCALVDEDIEMLAEALGFSDERDHTLQVLNIGMNKITSRGLTHLAKALRTNRTLISLSLIGNQIEDEGVSELCEILQKFPLTYEEVVLRRKRIFDQIFLKKAAVERYLAEKTKAEDENRGSKLSVKGQDRGTAGGRRIRGPDGKIRCVTGRDPKSKASVSKTNSGEKFHGKNRGGGDTTPRVEATPSEIFAIAQQVENETPPDKHPFVNEVIPSEDGMWCLGCWSLANLNLAFNYLTETSAKSLAGAVSFQRQNFKPPKAGLVRLVLSPGNWIPENSEEFQALQVALAQKSSKNEVPAANEPVPAGSVASVRRMSMSGRRTKNR